MAVNWSWYTPCIRLYIIYKMIAYNYVCVVLAVCVFSSVLKKLAMGPGGGNANHCHLALNSSNGSNFCRNVNRTNTLRALHFCRIATATVDSLAIGSSSWSAVSVIPDCTNNCWNFDLWLSPWSLVKTSNHVTLGCTNGNRDNLWSKISTRDRNSRRNFNLGKSGDWDLNQRFQL